jgi:hypothetical protein
LHLPEVAGDMAVDAECRPCREWRVLAEIGSDFFAVEMRLAGFDPALPFGVEGGALLGTEGVDALGFFAQEILVVGQLQFAVLDAQIKRPSGKSRRICSSSSAPTG